MAKKKSTLLGLTGESVGLGVTSMAGMGAMGALSTLPGMPAQASNVAGVVGSGLTLANVGQTAKIGLALPKLMGISSAKGKKTTKKVKKDKYSYNDICKLPKIKW